MVALMNLVLELDATYVEPSEESIARFRDQVAEALALGKPIVTPPGARLRCIDGGAPTAQMDRLLALLALSPEERTFVQSALTDGDGDKDFWVVFADYLEEKGVAGAERIRRTGPVAERPQVPPFAIRRPPEEPRRIGILRTSLDLVAAAIGLPSTSRIVAISDQAYFAYGQIGVRVEDPAFASVAEGQAIPEVNLEYTVGADEKIITKWRL